MTIRLPKFIFNGNNWLEQQQASILSAASIITFLTLLSAAAGLLKYRLLLDYGLRTGQGPQIEAYLVSLRLPEFVFQLLVMGALSAAFIPVFIRQEKISKKQAFRMASSVLNILLFTFLVFSALIFVFAYPLTALITGSKFSPDQIAASASMTRMLLLSQFFFAISSFLSGTIQSHKRFIIPAISPIAYNLGIIIGIVYLTPYFGINGAVLGVILGAFMHGALQIPLAIKLGFRYYPLFSFSEPGVKEILRLMGPRTISLSIDQFQLFLIVFFATNLGGNSYTIMIAAQALMTVPIRVFGAPIGQAALPFLSKEVNDGDVERLRGLIIRSLHQIAFFTMPAAVLLLILRIPLVRIVFGVKDLLWTDTLLTGKVVAILALSIAAQSMAHILIRSFYALHDTKSPLIVSALTTLVFLGISTISVFFTTVGVIGLGVAVTISTIFEMLALLVLLDRYLNIFYLKELWFPQLKILLASFLMAVFIWLPFRILDKIVFDTTRTIELVGLTISVGTIGMLTYILFAFILDVQELKILKKVFAAIDSWKKTLSRSTEVMESTGQTDDATF